MFNRNYICLVVFTAATMVGHAQTLLVDPPPTDASLSELLTQNLGRYRFWTMHVRPNFALRADVTWFCYIRTNEANEPSRRNNPWFVADVVMRDAKPLDVDLLSIGAHHRLHTLYLRVAQRASPQSPIEALPSVKLEMTEQYQDEQGDWKTITTERNVVERGQFAGFFRLPPAGAFLENGRGRAIKFRLTGEATRCVLEVCYAAHPPDSTREYDKFQPEDGGPPPPDPSQEDP